MEFEPKSLELPNPYQHLDFTKKIDREQLWRCDQIEAERLGYSNLKTNFKGDHWNGRVLTMVEYKYLVFDYCVKHDLFKKPYRNDFDTQEEHHAALRRYRDAVMLLKDDTLYAYKFLKFNGMPVKLFPYQDVIINDTHRWIDVELSNQIGKSFLLQVRGDIDHLRDHGKEWHVGLVSKSKEQNGQNMRRIKGFLKSANIEYEPGDNDSMSVTTRKVGQRGYTNNLICTVASTSALGYPFDRILADEYEFWTNPEGIEYMYDQVFKPRTFDTKGQIVIFSNPNGKNFVSEDLQTRVIRRDEAVDVLHMTEEEVDKMFGDQEEILQFHVYNFNFLDKPGNTMAEWNMEKRATHPIIFASTMAAQRTESMGSALSDAQIRDSNDSYLADAGKYAGKERRCYFFLDVGHIHDQSVLTGQYVEIDDGGMPHIKEFYKHYYPVTYPLWRVLGVDPEKIKGNNLDLDDGWDHAVGDNPPVNQVLEEFRYEGMLPLFSADFTGNDAMLPLCDIAGIPAINTKMSGPWKAKWYGFLVTLMAQRRFHRGKDTNWLEGKNKNWESQARTLQIRTKKQDGTAMPYPTYHHNTESDLDDALDSTVGCLSILDVSMDGGAGCEVIGQPPKKKDESDGWTSIEENIENETDEETIKLMNENSYGYSRFNY